MPFDVAVSTENGHSDITLKDAANSSSVQVYSFGALLNQFIAPLGDGFINVIDGFNSTTDAIENLTPFFKSAKLSPFPCRVKDGKYRFGQNEFQLNKYTSHGQALHGLIFDKPFTIDKVIETDEEATVVLEYVYDNALEGFPFRYKCRVAYSLTASNTLTVTTTITNMDNQLLPVADGWHPYFTLGDSINDYLVEFQSKEMLEFDEALIPTGKLKAYEEFGSLKTFGTTFFDNCFTLNFAECQPMCVIRNPAKKVQVEFYPDKSYPFIQFYTPPLRNSIAVENLSAAPDAFNNGMGLRILQPAESAIFTVQYVIRSL